MSFLALPSEELEDELVQLGEASRVSFPSKQPQEASRGEEEKTRVDERGLFGLGVKDFWREKSRKKRVRRGLTEGKKLPEQLEKLIGLANQLYIGGDLAGAVARYQEIVEIAPKLPSPYFALASIYEEIGEVEKEFEARLKVASFCKSHSAWLKVIELSWRMCDYEQGLQAANRAQMLQRSNFVWSQKILFLLHLDDVAAADGQLGLFLQNSSLEDRSFLLCYGRTCHKRGYNVLALRSYMSFLHLLIKLPAHKSPGDEVVGDDGVDGSDEEFSQNESSDELKRKHVSELPAHIRHELEDDLRYAFRQVFVLMVECGIFCQSHYLDISEAYSVTGTNQDSCDRLDSSSKSSTREGSILPEHQFLKELGGLLMLYYQKVIDIDKEQSVPLLACRNVDLSLLSLDMKILFSVCRLTLSALTSADLEVDSDEEDDLSAPSAKFCQLVSASSAVSSALSSFAQLHMEEQSIRNVMNSHFAGIGDAIIKRKWLRDNAISCEDEHDNSEKRGEEISKCFSLQEWHFFIAARVLAAKELHFCVGMKKEAEKLINKILLSPFVSVTGECTPCHAHEGGEGSSPLINMDMMRRIYVLQLSVLQDQLKSSSEVCDSSKESFLDCCEEAAARCGRMNANILLAMASTTRSLTNSRDRLDKMLNLMQAHVESLVENFNLRRKEYHSYDLSQLSAIKYSLLSDGGVMFSKKSLYEELCLIMTWAELQQGRQETDELSKRFVATATSFLVAIHSPSYKRTSPSPIFSNTKCMNSSSVLLGVVGSPLGGSYRCSRVLLRHIAVFEVITMNEMASVLSQPICASLYTVSSQFTPEESYSPPLLRFLSPLLNADYQKMAFCFYSLFLQFSILFTFCNSRSSLEKREVISLATKWNLKSVCWYHLFQSEENVWELSQRLKPVVCLHNPDDETNSDEELSKYTVAIFFSPPPMKSILSKRPSEAVRGDNKKLATGDSSEQQTVAEVLETPCDDPIGAATEMSIKLGEFVHSASLVSSRAAQLAYSLCMDPDDVKTANCFSREILSRAYSDPQKLVEANCSTQGSFVLSELHNVFISRFYSHFTKSTLSHLLHGHEYMRKGKYNDGLEQYIEAFRSAPEQPLAALCVATALFYLASTHRLVKSRREICSKNRQPGGAGESAVDASSRQQEILYNMGCIYRDMHMHHFAVQYLQKALVLEEKARLGHKGNSSRLPLTPEVAYCLVQIHRHAGQRREALEIMTRYLTF